MTAARVLLSAYLVGMAVFTWLVWLYERNRGGGIDWFAWWAACAGVGLVCLAIVALWRALASRS